MSKQYSVAVRDIADAHYGFCETCPGDDGEGIAIFKEEIEQHQQNGCAVTLLRVEVI